MVVRIVVEQRWLSALVGFQAVLAALVAGLASRPAQDTAVDALIGATGASIAAVLMVREFRGGLSRVPWQTVTSPCLPAQQTARLVLRRVGVAALVVEALALAALGPVLGGVLAGFMMVFSLASLTVARRVHDQERRIGAILVRPVSRGLRPFSWRGVYDLKGVSWMSAAAGGRASPASER